MNSSQQSSTNCRGRKAKCAKHDPRFENVNECRNCFELLKDGTFRPTRIKLCNGCNGHHSAKNFRREQEKHMSPNEKASSNSVSSANLSQQSFQPFQMSAQFMETLPPPPSSLQSSLQLAVDKSSSSSSVSFQCNIQLNNQPTAQPNPAFHTVTNIPSTFPLPQPHIHYNFPRAYATANIHLQHKNYDKAEDCYRELLENLKLHPQEYGPNHPFHIGAFYGIASIWNAKGCLLNEPSMCSIAQQIFDSVYVRRCTLLGHLHVESIQALYSKSIAVENQGRILESIALINDAVKCFAESVGHSHPFTTASHQDLVRMIRKLPNAISASQLIVHNHFENLANYIESGNVLLESQQPLVPISTDTPHLLTSDNEEQDGDDDVDACALFRDYEDIDIEEEEAMLHTSDYEQSGENRSDSNNDEEKVKDRKLSNRFVQMINEQASERQFEEYQEQIIQALAQNNGCSSVLQGEDTSGYLVAQMRPLQRLEMINRVTRKDAVGRAIHDFNSI